MNSPTAVGKRRSLSQMPNTEDQQLNLIAQEAESRLANSQAVLAEARKIRTHELERLRKENENAEDEQNGDDPGAQPTKPSSSSTSSVSNAVSKRLPSDDVFTSSTSQLKTRSQLSQQSSASSAVAATDLEEKYKRVMMTNAQLDNEKQMLHYEVDLLKEQLNDAEELRIEQDRDIASLRREMTEKKISIDELTLKCKNLQVQVEQRDNLMKEHGMVFVAVGEQQATSEALQSSALLSFESAQLLSQYDGSLGEKLNKFFQDKVALEEENKRLQNELEVEKSRAALSQKFPMADSVAAPPTTPGISAMSDSPVLDVETQRNITEYKLKLKRAEQEITTLQGAVTRLEKQVTRYKTAAETSEKAEEDLKQEKRKLQKELREAQELVQDLETKNGHLAKRLEKAKLRTGNDAS